MPFSVAHGFEAHGTPRNFPVSEITGDVRAKFEVDATKPWQLELGRGSGWHGLDTIKIDQTREATFYRLRHDRMSKILGFTWESSSARLSKKEVERIHTAIKTTAVLDLERSYHADVCDGTQWVLRIRQQEHEKSTYFNNHFPDGIVSFSEQLDAIIDETVGPDLKWRAVPSAFNRKHERELWDSIR